MAKQDYMMWRECMTIPGIEGGGGRRGGVFFFEESQQNFLNCRCLATPHFYHLFIALSSKPPLFFSLTHSNVVHGSNRWRGTGSSR